MKVLVFNQQQDLSISKTSVKPIIEEVLKSEERSTDEVAVYFVSTAEICRLHQDFFNDPSPTDCITLPLDQEETEDYHILGEIFVCPATAIEYVNKRPSPSKEAIYTETTLYVVHALLHLLGYDDLNPKDKKKMRAAESYHMKALIEHNLLLKGTKKSIPK